VLRSNAKGEEGKEKGVGRGMERGRFLSEGDEDFLTRRPTVDGTGEGRTREGPYEGSWGKLRRPGKSVLYQGQKAPESQESQRVASGGGNLIARRPKSSCQFRKTLKHVGERSAKKEGNVSGILSFLEINENHSGEDSELGNPGGGKLGTPFQILFSSRGGDVRLRSRIARR